MVFINIKHIKLKRSFKSNDSNEAFIVFYKIKCDDYSEYYFKFCVFEVILKY